MIKFEKPTGKIDRAKQLKHIALAVLELGPSAAGLAPNLPNITRELWDAFKAKHDPTEGERAWAWAEATTITALSLLAKAVRPQSPLASDELATVAADWVAGRVSLEDHGLSVEELDSPGDAPWLEALRAELPAFVKAVSPDAKPTPDLLLSIFRSRMSEAAEAVAAGDRDLFAPLEHSLTSPLAAGAERERRWTRHHRWIQAKYTLDPVFSPREEVETPLASLYIPLRGYWHEIEKEETAEDEKPKERVIAHLTDIATTLHDWVEAGEPKDRLRLISGGPGSGKSSFALAFANQVIAKGVWKVIFVELQRFAFADDFGAALTDHLVKAHAHAPLAGRGSSRFGENPLANRTERVLLIFDGLDELTTDQKKAAAISFDFVQGLRGFLQDAAEAPAPIRAIVLGRAPAFAAVEHRKLPTDGRNLICVAPIRPLVLDDYVINARRPAKEGDVKVDPRLEIADRDQRDAYWAGWAMATGDTPEAPVAISNEEMEDLNAEPLLLHLFILSGFAQKRWEEAQNNRNLVYRQIFHDIIQRNLDRAVVAEAGWDKESLFHAMECFGLAAWRGGGGRGARPDDFDAVAAAHAQVLLKRGLLKETVGLKLVALQTHGRPGEADGYEFIHKSFGEYLAACALIRAAKLTERGLNDPDRPASAEGMAADWVKLIDAAQMTPDLRRFLIDEARQRFAGKTKEAIAVKDALADVLSWAQRHGLPSHLEARDYRQAEARQTACMTAMIAAASAAAMTVEVKKGGDGRPPADGLVRIRWPEGDSVRREMWIAGDIQEMSLRVRPRRMLLPLLSDDRALSAALLARLDLSEAWFERLYLRGADLRGANLRGADLFGAHLDGAELNAANLNGADLSRANLIRANLSGADLSRANLIRANLSGAVLIEANLSGAELSGANLSDANLNGAKLGGANLRGANLIRANLSGEDLSGADLGGADLIEANLSDANCSRIHIDSARLQFADLSEALDLSQDAVNAAHENSETKLPEGLIRPAHWADED